MHSFMEDASDELIIGTLACVPALQTSNAASEAVAVEVEATVHLQLKPTSSISSNPLKASEAVHTKMLQANGQSATAIFALSQLAAKNWAIRIQSPRLKASSFWHAM